nr:hypothetical protein [Lachnospiraceae bacterium]
MKKRNLQRIFAAFMATAMVIGATGCDNKDKDTKNDTTPTPDATTTDAPKADDGKKDETTPEPTKDAEVTPEATPEATPDEPAVDLGGMKIIIRDWWSPALDAEYPAEAKSDYEEARNAYREEVETKYNFSMREAAISDWGGANSDFVDYVTSGGDSENYIFTLHTDPTTANAMASGLMYDLSTLDCLDFSEDKFQRNKLHEQYCSGSSIYAFFPGFSE